VETICAGRCAQEDGFHLPEGFAGVWFLIRLWIISRTQGGRHLHAHKARTQVVSTLPPGGVETSAPGDARREMASTCVKDMVQ